MHAIVDLSPVLAGSVAKAMRGVAVIDGDHVVVRDEIETLDRPATIRWNMVTPATVKITGRNSAELTKDGKTLFLRVREPARITMKTWTTVPTHDYDSPNPGTSMVGFEAVLPANSKRTVTVLLVPPRAASRAMRTVPVLSRWPGTAR